MSTSARAETAEQMAHAADSWLSSLGDDERAVAQRAFPSDDDRRRWFYTPTDHGGLALGAMSPARQQGALRLLATGLSVAGYNTVATIMGLENILDAREGWGHVFDRERGHDPGMYYVRVFGEPGTHATWAWRFGGHHVSINHLVVDGEASRRHRASWGPTRRRRRSSARTCSAHSAGWRISGVSSCDRCRRRKPGGRSCRPCHPPIWSAPTVRDVSTADAPLPLPQLFRTTSDDQLQAGLAQSQRRTEEALGIRPDHIDAVRFSTLPKGAPVADFDGRSA